MTTNYNDIADDYQKTKEHPVKNYCEAFTFLRVLGDMAAKSALDLACGDGFYTRLIKQHGAAQVIGIDLSEDMVNNARVIEAADPLGIEYRVGDAADLGRIGEFDIVTAVSLFPYASTKQNLAAMCSTMHDNLKPDDRLITITVNPTLSLHDLDMYDHYGVRLAANEALQDGTIVKAMIDIPGGAIELSTYFWKQKTYEQILRQVGFRDVVWHAYHVSEDGIRTKGEAYWQMFLAKPYTIILEGHK